MSSVYVEAPLPCLHLPLLGNVTVFSDPGHRKPSGHRLPEHVLCWPALSLALESEAGNPKLHGDPPLEDPSAFLWGHSVHVPSPQGPSFSLSPELSCPAHWSGRLPRGSPHMASRSCSCTCSGRSSRIPTGYGFFSSLARFPTRPYFLQLGLFLNKTDSFPFLHDLDKDNPQVFAGRCYLEVPEHRSPTSKMRGANLCSLT